MYTAFEPFMETLLVQCISHPKPDKKGRRNLQATCLRGLARLLASSHLQATCLRGLKILHLFSSTTRPTEVAAKGVVSTAAEAAHSWNTPARRQGLPK